MGSNGSSRVRGNGDRKNGDRISISRRSMLAGSLGTGVLVALPGRALAESNQSIAVQAAGNATGQLFIYGMPAAQSAASTVQAAQFPQSRAALARPTTLATGIAALPVQSADLSTLAMVETQVLASGIAALTLTLVDTASGAVAASGTLALPDFPQGAMLLARPVISTDNATVVIILSITIPSNLRTRQKVDPRDGEMREVETATWTSHHEIAYFWQQSQTFSGPYSLGDAPSLAAVTAVADSTDLYLWTMPELAAMLPAHKTKQEVAPLIPRIVPTLAAYPFGSAKPRYTVPAPGPWPGDEASIAVLPDGNIIRQVGGYTVIVYTATNGDSQTVNLPALNLRSARTGIPTMKILPNGLILFNNPAVGRAMIADPGRSFMASSVISYQRPAAAGGAPSNKAVLSADGSTLYLLGGYASGGLVGYDVATRKLTMAYSQGTQYNGLYPASNGNLLAVAPGQSSLAFFDASLAPTATLPTDLSVAAIF